MRSTKRALQKRPPVARERSGEERMLDKVFLAYLAVTGSAFLVLLFEPAAADSPALQAFADAVGRVLTVVEDSEGCTNRPQARRVFVAIVVVALHVMVPAITLWPAWLRRRIDDAEPLTRPRLRDMLELLGAPPLFVGLYWYTFFAMEGVACGHLASVWLRFTVQGTMAVAFVCVLLAATRSLLFRLWKR